MTTTLRHVDSSVTTPWCESGTAPAVVVASGDTLVVDCTSFTSGLTFDQVSSLDGKHPMVAALTGPIVLNQAKPGDVLRVDILDLKVSRDFGCVLLSPGRGAFPDTVTEFQATPVTVAGESVALPGGVTIPVRKMLGKVSVAPAQGRVPSGLCGRHGGNMDNRHVTVGSSVYLPVFVEGAYLGLGDGHAAQGDGECGMSGVEVEMTATVRVVIETGFDLGCPLVRSGGRLMLVGSGDSLEAAASAALGDMRRLLVTHLNISQRDATIILTSACDVEVCRLASSNVTVRACVSDEIIRVRN